MKPIIVTTTVPSSGDCYVTFTMMDDAGQTIATGHVAIDQVSKFLGSLELLGVHVIDKPVEVVKLVVDAVYDGKTPAECEYLAKRVLSAMGAPEALGKEES